MSLPVTLRTETGDEHIDLADFETRLQKGEVSPQCLVRFVPVTGERFVAACELELYKALHQPRRAYFARAFSFSRFPWLTAALIFLNLAVYLYTVRSGPLDIDDMVRFGGKVGPLVTDLGETWRLLTANFLHRDAMHLGLNMFVLFNVGGMLENTYRTLDYLWLLVVSGIATMTASLFFADAVSIGGSGIVFGCLGGVVVFGVRFRALLPSRYRRVMSEAAVPTLLGLLLIGITSKGVDNWGHLGGLVAGMTAAALMRPALLVEPKRFWWQPTLRLAPSMTVLCVVLFGQHLFGPSLPRLHLERDDEFGLAIPLPYSWRQGANPLGTLAWYNGLPGLGRASFAAEAVEMPEGADAKAHAEHFIEERLVPKALGTEVLKLRHDAATTARLGDRDAVKVQAFFEEPAGATWVWAYFVPKGEIVYQLIFTFPADFPRYGQVVEHMAANLRFDEPRDLRRARANALLFPNSASAWGQLGLELRSAGETVPAIEALTLASRKEPSSALWREELAVSLLRAGEVERGCEASHAAVLYAPEDPRALEVDARCELARGNPKLALEKLGQARVLAPADPKLRAAEAKLRAELGI